MNGWSLFRCWIGPLLVLVSCTQTSEAQNESPAQGTAPTIYLRARIVVLDVVVTDRKGNPVQHSLTRDDFSVVEDKEPQTIRSFEAPPDHAMPAGDAGVTVKSAADLPRIGAAPVTVMVLDELNGRFEDMAYAREMMVKYLAAQPAVLPQPTVLLIATNTKFLQVHDYTQARDELLEVIRKHMPEYPWRMMNSGRSGPGAVDRMAQVLASLQQIAQASIGTPGRKNIIWVGNGFPSANLVSLDPKQADLVEAAIRRVTSQLLAARATLYTINPTLASMSTVDVVGAEDVDSSSGENGQNPFGTGSVDFTQLAPATGGLAFTGRNDLNNLIAQGIQHGQEYYTLSYSPTDTSDDPARFRRIRILMRDRELRATTRQGYYQETATDLNPVLRSEGASVQQIQRNLSLDLSQALTSFISYNGLDVTAEQTGGKGMWTITVKGNGIHWTEPKADGEQHEEGTVGAAWYDAKGKILGHIFKEEVAIREAASSQISRFSLQVAPAGAVRIRFVVRDALNGHLGTIDVTHF